MGPGEGEAGGLGAKPPSEEDAKPPSEEDAEKQIDAVVKE